MQYLPSDAMSDFIRILSRLDDKEKKIFLNGLHTAVFDPEGRKILLYLTKND